MNADGTNQVNLTNNPAWDTSPSWSPVSSAIRVVGVSLQGKLSTTWGGVKGSVRKRQEYCAFQFPSASNAYRRKKAPTAKILAGAFMSWLSEFLMLISSATESQI